MNSGSAGKLPFYSVPPVANLSHTLITQIGYQRSRNEIFILKGEIIFIKI
ncbi:hypothetical protein LV84_01615 [Algoriphagus ratkowskyi]|uniref:Uncharacterized protein n=1 Tax=Algoriphagus ratkowskyi TaxID=57028 RepID=A0A2W7RSY2_9BACT|nr:hypothetical protein LV84_01615 [Algoriphagus ratkowskyi]